MSFGKMNTFVDVVQTVSRKDAEGFANKGDEVLASALAYREGHHGTQKWANRASFSEATDLFCFRTIPGIGITTAMDIICEDGRFEIISVEDVKSRGIYIEVLAKKVASADG